MTRRTTKTDSGTALNGTSADISVDISHSRYLGKYQIIWQKHPVAESADMMESLLFLHRLGSGETNLLETKTKNNSLMHN